MATFAFNAFAASTYDVAERGSGSNWLPTYMWATAARARALAAQERERERIKQPDVDHVVAQARARINFKPMPYVRTDLSPIVARLHAARTEREMVDFLAATKAIIDAEMAMRGGL